MASHVVTNPAWTIAAPLGGVAAFAAITASILPAGEAVGGIICGVLLAACVFSAVHHAEIVAARVGEPFGSIVLALAVTVLEVGLILSLMLSAGDAGATIARDTVYSAIMIITAGVVGFSLLFGSRRHFEQQIRIRGTSSALAVLTILAIITLVLPNHTVAASGPAYNAVQLIMVAIISLVLYATFIFVQTIRHRDYFLPENGSASETEHAVPAVPTVWTSAAFLCVSLFVVIMLAKSLSPYISSAISALGLPLSFTGVIIAGLVLLPEGIAAVRAAIADRLQISINLALGSGLATIGLTIPAVAAASLIGGFPLQLGISTSQTALLALALFVSAVTLGNGRTNILLGVAHLSIFAMFLLISAVP